MCVIPVVPLLETIDDLEAGPEILEAFLSHPFARRSQQYLKDVNGAKSFESASHGGNTAIADKDGRHYGKPMESI